MTSDQTGLRVAGAWLAGASLLLALALAFHGPLHPDLEVQMTHVGESASRWAAVHWTAAAAFSCFAIAAVLMLVSRSRMTSTGKTISAWAVVLVGALWTLTTAVTEVTVLADLATSRDLASSKRGGPLRRGTGTASQCSRWQWPSLPGTSTGIHFDSFRGGRRRQVPEPDSRHSPAGRSESGSTLAPRTSCGSLRRG
jgi:hypothetical protein